MEEAPLDESQGFELNVLQPSDEAFEHGTDDVEVIAESPTPVAPAASSSSEQERRRLSALLAVVKMKMDDQKFLFLH